VTEDPEWPWILLPRPLGRHMRIGPFASTVDLAKFVTVAFVGALVASVTTPFAWIPFVGIGLAISLSRSRGPPLEARLLRYGRWRLRTAAARPTRYRARWSRARSSLPTRGSQSRDFRAGGLPTAYLPPDELRARFEAWRTFLRSFSPPTFLRVGGRSVPSARFLGTCPPDAESEERAAQAAYREFVVRLLRDRYERSVEVAIFDSAGREDGVGARRDSAGRAFVEWLERMSIPVEDRRERSAIERGDG
jgi:hypothetical protein